MQKEQILNYFLKCFWVFVIGCFIGFIWETLFILVKNHKLESRQGLVFGPFIPVYGIGLLFYFLITPNIKNTWYIFFASVFLGGLIEFLYSYFQEKFFGTVSWDYSSQPFNLQGRTSLICCIFWGICGVIFTKRVFPYLDKILDRVLPIGIFRTLTGIMLVFIIFNITISTCVGIRQKKRIKNESLNSTADYIIDEYYPDEVLQKKFPSQTFRI